MALFLSQRWKKQPTGNVGIDWGNSINTGLVAAFNFNGQAYDAVNRRYQTSGVNYGYGYGRYGRNAQIGSGTGGLTFTGPEYQQVGDVTAFYMGSAGSSAYLVETATSDGGSATPFEFLLAGASPKIYWSRANTAGNYRTWQSANTFSYVTDYKIMVSAVAEISTAPTMYLNGEIYNNTNTGGTGTGAATVNTSNIMYFGKRQDGTAGSTFATEFMLWKRVLTYDEAVALNENPWIGWAPVPRRTYIGTAASASFNAAWNNSANTVITGANAA
jgi:hypothetical protein